MTRPGIASDSVVTRAALALSVRRAGRSEAEEERAAQRRSPGAMQRVLVLPISHALLPPQPAPRLAIDREESRIETRSQKTHAGLKITPAR
jgi:hypothetical protein